MGLNDIIKPFCSSFIHQRKSSNSQIPVQRIPSPRQNTRKAHFPYAIKLLNGSSQINCTHPPTAPHSHNYHITPQLTAIYLLFSSSSGHADLCSAVGFSVGLQDFDGNHQLATIQSFLVLSEILTAQDLFLFFFLQRVWPPWPPVLQSNSCEEFTNNYTITYL